MSVLPSEQHNPGLRGRFLTYQQSIKSLAVEFQLKHQQLVFNLKEQSSDELFDPDYVLTHPHVEQKFSTTNLTLKSVTVITTNYLQNLQRSLTPK